MSNPCQCGKPAHDGVLCPQCGDDLRNRLRLIADRWTDLEAALTSSEPGGEKGHTKNGMIEVGTTLNEAAVKARRACTDVVWFMLQVLRDDLDSARRPFTPPPTSVNRSQDDTPALALWLATWHVGHFTHDADPESAAEIVGESRVDTDVPPLMGGEDFAYMLEKRPGAMVFIGNGDSAGLHNPAYDFNDEAIAFGCSYWVRLVERAMPGAP